MLVRADLLERRFNRLNFYIDPRLFMYCEEIDLAFFAKQTGAKCVITRDAVAYHKLAHSSGGRANTRSYYYLTRNRVYLARRLLSPFVQLMFHLYYAPTRCIRIIQYLLSGRRETALAILCGLIDGYAERMGKWAKHDSYRNDSYCKTGDGEGLLDR